MSDGKQTGGPGAENRRELWHHMREPVLTFLALAVFLVINVALGWLQPFPHPWMIELPIMVLMIATVLLFSMEVIEEPSLVRFFSILGFCWVAILFTMTLIDYTTR